jgi:two-component system, sensor histidine kinase
MGLWWKRLGGRLRWRRGDASRSHLPKTRFLAAASHDLQQPLRALSLYASVLEDRVADPDALRLVRGIQLSARSLEQLFDDLVDISRIEAGTIRPAVDAFPLLPLMQRVAEAERPFAAQKGLALRLAPTSVVVRSDEMLLGRMLRHLVSNAIRHTERGGVVVGCRRMGRDRVRLLVADSGAGIPAEEQERIFDEYHRLEGTRLGGLGLGLPIVRRLGELLGHSIALRSAPGRGSAFSVELERAKG